MLRGFFANTPSVLRRCSSKVLYGNSESIGCKMLFESCRIPPILHAKALSGNPFPNDTDNQRSPQRGRSKRSNKTDNRNPTLSKEVREYLSSKDSLSQVINTMPHEFLKKRKKSQEFLYIVDADVAKQFVDAVTAVWSVHDGDVILEGNPGLGLVSKELIKAGVKNLHLYESCFDFHPVLYDLQKKHPNIVKISNKDIFSIWRLAYQDKMDNGSRVSEILSQLPKRQWKEDPAIKVIGPLPTTDFVKHLMRSIIFQTGIVMHGRLELYLALPPYLYFHLTCGKDVNMVLYRSSSVLFQLFFEIELLTKVPRKAYFPWNSEIVHKKFSKFKKVKTIDTEYLYVVKIIPKRDLYDAVAPIEKLQPLWYFVVHHFIKRKNRIIPELERWIPGCGPRLILQGMNIFTQFGDLTPQEVLALFNEFSSWPEYPHSPFLASMETMFLKMEQSSEEVEKEIADSDIDNLQSAIVEEDDVSEPVQQSH